MEKVQKIAGNPNAMTKFWLDFDQKIFAPTNLNVGT